MGGRCRRVLLAIILVAAGAGAGACGGGSGPDETTDSPPPPASHDVVEPQPAPAAGITVNLDEIFPAGPGRELVLNNCQNCHTFVPLVVLQMDRDGWYRNSLDHRERVPKVS